MKKLLLPLLALAALALPARATLPRPTAAPFSYGAKLTVSGYQAGKPALSGFPVLVRISEDSPSGFSYNAVQNKSATDWDDIDLAFVDMLGNGLPFEIDTWNPSGDSLVWVRLPTMQNGTEFVMCWGSTSSGRAVCSDKPWADYTGVWHLKEEGGSGTTVFDSTANALNGQTYAGSTIDGAVGAGRVIAGNNDHAYGIVVDVLSDPTKKALAESLGTDFHASFWMVAKGTEDNVKYGTLLCRRKGDQGYSWMISFGGDTKTGQTIDYMRVNSDNPNSANIFTKQPIGSFLKQNDEVWKKVDVVWKYATNGNVPVTDVYTNGVLAETIVHNKMAVRQEDANIGIGGSTQDNPANVNGRKGRRFNGAMDEVRLRKGATSADWVEADWATQTDAAFLTPGTAEEYPQTDDPFAVLSFNPIQYTNATAIVAVNSLGTDADSATIRVEFAEDSGFASVVKSDELVVDGAGTFSFAEAGLAYGTIYYVRASITNNQNRWVNLGPFSFTTQTPGLPAGTASIVSPGYTTLGATAMVSSFGTGGESATMWLEASTASDFSAFVSGSAVTAVVGTAADLSVAGLSPDTAYNLRVRIRNNWGIDTIVPLISTSTRAVPFATTGLAFAESTGDTIDFTFPMTDIYDGATVEAVLTYNGNVASAQTTGVPTAFSWAGVAAASGTATATVVATATLPNNGGTVTKEWTVSVVPGATSTIVTGVSAHASAAGALWVRPGDVVVLPEAVGNVSYQVLNERFASVEGNTLTALEPGIVGVRCVDAFFNTNIMGVVILPNAIGSGSVYVYDETKYTDDSWTRAASWKKVDGNSRSAAASNDSWPKNADDIAILPFYNRTGQQYIRHRADITVGGLYTGMIRPEVQAECVLERYKDDATKTVTFRRTDGEPVRVQICPNGYHGTYQSQLRLGGYSIDVVWASDAVIDCGSSETDHKAGPVGTFNVPNTTTPCMNTLQGVTLTVQGLPGRYINGSGATREFHGTWKGSGTIVKKGQGGIAFQGDLGGFSGSFVLKGEKNLGGIQAPASQLLIRGGGATNVSATVYGVVEVNSNGGITQNNAAGLFGTSAQVSAASPITDAVVTFNGESGPRGPDAPAKGLALFGGAWYAGRIDNKTWGVDTRDNKVLDYVAVGSGVSYIYLQPRNNNKDGYPINVVTVKELRQTDRGTLAVNDASRQKAPTEVPACMFYANDWADHATGAAGDCLTSSIHPVIPWILAPVNSNDSWDNTAFATCDENGRLVQEMRENSQITQASSPDANLYMTGKNLNYGSAGGDYTINSLYINNGSQNKWLGEGRTLRIKSGGLILQGSSAIGLPGRTDNGALVLGDATHPAYVWAKAINANTNYLGAAVTAAGGFVSAYPGNLCLVGDQTGIADEIAVNGGTLAIGTADADCALAEGIPIRVCTGASLLLPTVTNAVAASPIKLDGAGKNRAKVILPVNQSCASISVRDVYESDAWTALPAGTYGSSGSGAEFVRDDLFAGPGVLTVGPAAPSTDVMLLIW